MVREVRGYAAINLVDGQIGDIVHRIIKGFFYHRLEGFIGSRLGELAHPSTHHIDISHYFTSLCSGA